MSRIVVTAQWLEDLRRAGREIELPRDALITPAARDWLKEYAAPVTWRDADGGGTGGTTPVVIDLAVPMMRSWLAALERLMGAVETIEPSDAAGGVIAAVRKLCTGVATGKWPRGIVFADDAGLSVCIANKIRGIRAALGTDVPSVEQAVRRLAINVLILDPSRQTMHQVRQMVERFAVLRPGDAARAAMEAISGLEGAGGADR